MCTTVDAGLQRDPVLYRRCMSPYNAPPRLVVKPNGAMRFTVNYRGLNKQEIRSAHELEMVDRVIDNLSDPEIRLYSKFDFSNCYFSIPVEESSQIYLAFSYPGGQVCPTTLPQGLGGASQTCAAAVKIAFGPIPPPNPEPSLYSNRFNVYQDDSFRTDLTFDEMYEFLRDHLFPRILWSRFSLSFRKLELGMSQVQGLGVQFYAGGRVEVLPKRLEKIRDWATPRSPTEVRAFLGAMGICRRWIKNYSEKARPLTKLTGRGGWMWRPDVEERSFQLIKQSIIERLEMYGPRPGHPCVVYTCSTTRTGGVVILQAEERGCPLTTSCVLRPILYDSVSLPPTAQRYSDLKREFWVLIQFLKKYRHLIHCEREPSIICTPRPEIIQFRNLEHDRLASSWMVLLEEMHVEFRLVTEAKMAAVRGVAEAVFPDDLTEVAVRAVRREIGRGGQDGRRRERKQQARRERWRERTQEIFSASPRILSGYSPDRGGVGGSEEIDAPLPDAPSEDQDTISEERPDEHLAAMTEPDAGLSVEPHLPAELYYASSEWYRDLVLYLNTGVLPKSHRSMYTHAQNFKRKASRYSLVGDRLYYRFANGRRASCVKESQVIAVLQEAHDRHGHFASKTVLKRLSDLWWPTRAADVQQWTATCKACAYFGPTKRSEPMKPVLTYDPFDMLGIDFIGPLDLTSRGNRYILHVVDYFTRYSWAYPLPAASGQCVMNVMEQFFRDFTTPLVIYSDRGTHFVGKEISRFWKRSGVRHIASPAASPRSTGMVEKHNGLLEERLRRLTNAAGGHELGEWDKPEFLKEASRALNTREMTVHGFSPFQLLFGVAPRLRLPMENPMLASLPGVCQILIDGAEGAVDRPSPCEGEPSWFEGRREEWRAEARSKRIAEAVRTVARSRERLTLKGVIVPGDMVMLLDSHVAAQKGMKLHGRWNGPFLVVSKTRGSSYILRHPHSGENFPGTHHRDSLKLFLPRPARLGGKEREEETSLPGRTNLRRYATRVRRDLMGKV